MLFRSLNSLSGSVFIGAGGNLDLFGTSQSISTLTGAGAVTNTSLSVATIVENNTTDVTFSGTLVDGAGVGDVGQAVLRDRRKLSADGVVVVVLTIDPHRGEVVAGPDLVNRGFVYDETAGDILAEGRNRVMLAVEEHGAAGVVDRTVLAQTVRRVLARYFFEVTERKPVILPVVMEV